MRIKVCRPKFGQTLKPKSGRGSGENSPAAGWNVIPLAPVLWLSKVVLFDVETLLPPTPLLLSLARWQVKVGPKVLHSSLRCDVFIYFPAGGGKSAHITAPLCTWPKTRTHTKWVPTEKCVHVKVQNVVGIWIGDTLDLHKIIDVFLCGNEIYLFIMHFNI